MLFLYLHFSIITFKIKIIPNSHNHIYTLKNIQKLYV